MIQAKVRSNIKMPKFNFQNDLRNIAQKIVIPLLADGIEKNKGITGKKFPANEPSTVRRKGSNDPLIDTGTLRSSFQYKRRGKLSVVINLKSVRARIGKYLQVDGIRSNRGRKYFNFFGVTEGMQKNAMSYMRARIRKAIQNA